MELCFGISVGTLTYIVFSFLCFRPTMILYKIDNIRELMGPKVNLQMVYDNPICRLDK